jgi:DNA segregation ATPase FtsK/SpoIIIE, S-DNA-T family
MPQPAPGKSTKSHKSIQKIENNPHNLQDQASALKVHFGRFLWDILGVFSFALGLVTLFGFLGLSHGTLLEGWIRILKDLFGWGSIFLIILSGVAGVLAFQRSREKLKISWIRVIFMELVFFLSLGILSAISGNKLGVDVLWGGQVGWGLSMLFTRALGSIWGTVVLFLFWGFSIGTAFDLWRVIENWFVFQIEQSGETNSSSPSGLDKNINLVEKNLSGNEVAKGNKRTQLPPEFRKSLKVRDEKGARPPVKITRDATLPPLNILMGDQLIRPDERTINQNAGLIEKSLSEFGIPAKVIGFKVGPAVTQFAVQPGFIRKGSEQDAQLLKVRVAQIASLQKDLALALSAQRIRIEAPVPGRGYVGIEVPNTKSMVVRLKSLIETEEFNKIRSPLAVSLGRDVSGNPLVADLARMPHLLIAGTTGSGKSVCISALATCLAMNNSPRNLRMVMIDSKMVELIRFNGLPHLFGKVETDIQRILGVLKWIVVEMEHRYKLLEAAKAKDIDTYNQKLLHRKDIQPLPKIVVFIDEMADLMMSAPDQTEHNLVRLAQMARATGIHLVVATQRPSTDVVTGLIKANFPARLAFAVASGVDSRVILDLPGAETLLGHGDLLFLNPEVGSPIRAQGVMVADQEIERVISYWQEATPQTEIRPPWESLLSEMESEGEDDVLVEKAITLLKKDGRASASMLQRRLRIGYPRAARLLDQLEEMGIVGPLMGGGRDREILIDRDETPDGEEVTE